MKYVPSGGHEAGAVWLKLGNWVLGASVPSWTVAIGKPVGADSHGEVVARTRMVRAPVVRVVPLSTEPLSSIELEEMDGWYDTVPKRRVPDPPPPPEDCPKVCVPNVVESRAVFPSSATRWM